MHNLISVNLPAIIRTRACIIRSTRRVVWRHVLLHFSGKRLHHHRFGFELVRLRNELLEAVKIQTIYHIVS